ncbi:hypothetical protein POM88_002636 [Heracleum sosnowskyi]|uniref:DUF4283 domain-containing protein n=1 Tax=Heracleum sosnowskyi TaxID=360622 RepID=A0AAD8JI13_9APIA|nr:hypothetical protein POM88_002636 [Heracleum sosnowskyi]
MFEISLEEEEEGGIAIEEKGGDNEIEQQSIGDPKLCLVGKFLTEGVIDFTAMQHTLAALWKPGKGVYIKAVDTNLFVFQFYHVIDLNRVVDGSPWSFNRRVLLLGHKFCSKLFDTPENEITKPYGVWMRAQPRRHNNLIGAKWLRYGEESTVESEGGISLSRTPASKKVVQQKDHIPDPSERINAGGNLGENAKQKDKIGSNSGLSNSDNIKIGGKNITGGKSIIVENKKRRTDCDGEEFMGINTEIDNESENESMDQDGINSGPKNGFAAGSESRARQGL